MAKQDAIDDLGRSPKSPIYHLQALITSTYIHDKMRLAHLQIECKYILAQSRRLLGGPRTTLTYIASMGRVPCEPAKKNWNITVRSAGADP